MRYFLLAALLSLVPGSSALAQRDTLPPGVSLATRYTKAGRPLVSVRPFAVSPSIRPFADQISGIIQNDLTRSDRFAMIASPATLEDGPVNYAAWNSINVMYLVTGTVNVTGSGAQLALTLHDVPYGNVKQSRNFNLPPASAREFRLAVHTVSDEIVRWITNGQPGMAATRIVFARQNGNGSNDLMIVDSDGEDLRRLTGTAGRIYSPTWSPDGRKLAYTIDRGNGSWQLVERDMASGTTRTIVSGGLLATPAYTARGNLIFAMWVDRGAASGFELHEASGGTVRRITNTPGDNLSPSASPDGRQITFHSTRTGRHHVYVMPAAGGNMLPLSPVGEKAEYHAPDWSSTGSQVVFHGLSGGVYQLMSADASRPGGQVTQLTRAGRSEDPSWAPDGRHIVYTGVGAGGPGLYVIDVVTGEGRLLVGGSKLRMADWSGSLALGMSLPPGP